MQIRFYVNRNFIRGNVSHGKIMFCVEGLGYFGVFINGQNGKIEKQAYDINMNYKNITGDKYTPSIIIKDYVELSNSWNNISKFEQEKIFRASMKTIEAFKYFIKKYNNSIKAYSNPPYTSLDVIESISNYVWYFVKFVTNLHENHVPAIDPKFENGIFLIDNPEVKTETIKDTSFNVKGRDSIKMFKLINANNLADLFEGNFYPIIKQENGYVTIKDNNGKDFIIRANRGKEIQVFTECPA